MKKLISTIKLYQDTKSKDPFVAEIKTKKGLYEMKDTTPRKIFARMK